MRNAQENTRACIDRWRMFGLIAIGLLATLSVYCYRSYSSRQKCIMLLANIGCKVRNTSGNYFTSRGMRPGWRIDCDDSTVSDTDVEMVIEAVVELNPTAILLERTFVSDLSVNLLLRAKSIRILKICETGISPAGVALLHTMPELEILEVDAPMLTISSAKQLSMSKSLWTVRVKGSKFENDDPFRIFMEFANCKSLQQIQLIDSGLSEMEIDELRRSLPNLDIRNEPALEPGSRPGLVGEYRPSPAFPAIARFPATHQNAGASSKT
jgi:hypothetical protein